MDKESIEPNNLSSFDQRPARSINVRISKHENQVRVHLPNGPLPAKLAQRCDAHYQRTDSCRVCKAVCAGGGQSAAVAAGCSESQLEVFGASASHLCEC